MKAKRRGGLFGPGPGPGPFDTHHVCPACGQEYGQDAEKHCEGLSQWRHLGADATIVVEVVLFKINPDSVPKVEELSLGALHRAVQVIRMIQHVLHGLTGADVMIETEILQGELSLEIQILETLSEVRDHMVRGSLDDRLEVHVNLVCGRLCGCHGCLQF